MLLRLYKTVMRASTPVLEAYLQKRTKRGKEDIARAHERRGRPQKSRSPAPLVWLHAASVGESLSLLAIIDRLLADYPAISVMVTTGTVTSARLMAERLPARAFHQYLPVDHPAWVETFLDHWRPDCVIWAESEFWPNMLMAIQTRRIPAVLLNARLSQETFLKWQLARGPIRRMLRTFSLCLAQNDAEANRLVKLGAQNVRVSANLKYAASPLPFDATELEKLQKATAGRTLLLWASTHPGEEEIAMETHAVLRQAFPALLTIIVPRHPQRGKEIAGTAWRSKGDAIDANTAIYIADTLGEMGLFYRLCKTVVVGGSFADIGGHNPIEPGQLGCVIFYGPVMYNFATISADFLSHHAAIQVKDAAGLRLRLTEALQHPEKFAACAGAAQKLTQEKSRVADDIMREMQPHLKNKLGQAAS